MFDPDLPSNKLVYEIRRQPEVFRNFPAVMEEMMARYGLSEVERAAWRDLDVHRLRDLGVHPYFLPQITRLIKGSAKNDSRSEAAEAYRRSMVERS